MNLPATPENIGTKYAGVRMASPVFLTSASFYFCRCYNAIQIHNNLQDMENIWHKCIFFGKISSKFAYYLKIKSCENCLERTHYCHSARWQVTATARHNARSLITLIGHSHSGFSGGGVGSSDYDHYSSKMLCWRIFLNFSMISKLNCTSGRDVGLFLIVHYGRSLRA